MCKQLNGPVLKSLKPSYLGRNRKKNWPGRVKPGPKFCILFQAGPGSGRNFNLSFGPGPDRNFNFFSSRAGPRPKIFPLLRAAPGLKTPARADLYYIHTVDTFMIAVCINVYMIMFNVCITAVACLDGSVRAATLIAV